MIPDMLLSGGMCLHVCLQGCVEVTKKALGFPRALLIESLISCLIVDSVLCPD